MPAKRKTASPKDSTANLGFEAKLWLAADKLRNNMDAAEPERSGGSQPQPARRASEARQYSRAERDRLPKAARRADAEASVNHVVLGLIFLINQHLKRIFSDNELEENSVVKHYLIAAADGKNYQTKHHSLQAIITESTVAEAALEWFGEARFFMHDPRSTISLASWR